jgi:hypothetical protein
MMLVSEVFFKRTRRSASAKCSLSRVQAAFGRPRFKTQRSAFKLTSCFSKTE